MKKNLNKRIFYVLLIIALVLLTLNVLKTKGWLIPSQPPVVISDGVIRLDSMTTEQKVAQMVVVGGLKENYVPWRKMQVGGLHLFALPTEHIFNNTIVDFQYGVDIPFFITADQEGCVTPFAHLKQFKPASEISELGEAFEKGFVEGAYLKSLGFNLNFAPVVDLDDEIWKCRAFKGDSKKIAELAQAYTLGLQTQGVIATAKHYPGKTLVVKDPHKYIVSAEISKDDILPYDYLIEKGDVGALMVSHLITTGAVETNGIPSVVSPEIINSIKNNYNGLIVSDEIHMLGLKKYFSSLDELYVAVYKAGNDLILNFDRDPNEVYRMIKIVSAAVDSGIISRSQIDNSVRKILVAKGFTVV